MSQIASGPQTPSFSGGAENTGVEYGAAAEAPVGSGAAIDNSQTDLPEYSQAGDNPQIGTETSGAGAVGGAAAGGGAAAPNAVQLELQSLSNAFGQDFTGFTSVVDARNAARIIAEGYAQRGLQQNQGGWGVPQHQPQQQPIGGSIFDHNQGQGLFQQPYQPAPNQQGGQQIPEVDLGFDIKDLDPKLQASITKLQQQAQQAIQQSQQLVQNVQNQFTNSQKQQVQARAHAALDGFNNPRYGAGQLKNSTQILARQGVERLVNSIVDGMVSNRQPVPPIEQVVQMAVLLDAGVVPGQQGQQQQQQQQPHAMKPTSQQAGPRTLALGPKRAVNPNYDPLGLLNDDDFRRGLQEIAAKY